MAQDQRWKIYDMIENFKTIIKLYRTFFPVPETQEEMLTRIKAECKIEHDKIAEEVIQRLNNCGGWSH
jgi:hypothetical protein